MDTWSKQTQFKANSNPIKPNLPDAKMDVNIYYTKVYENISDWTLGQNKPNSNPIKPNFQKAQMIVNSLITKDYRKYDDFAVRKNLLPQNLVGAHITCFG